MPSEENPRAVQLLAWLYSHKGGTDKSALEEEDSEMDLRTVDERETFTSGREGLRKQPGIHIGNIFRHALNVGWIRPEDKVWILKQLEVTEV
jgi:hypothetical protein